MADSQIFPEIAFDFEALSTRFREMCYLNQALTIHFHPRHTPLAYYSPLRMARMISSRR